ncbi:MAG: hypothetical protein ACFB50_02495 [Rubrobacteraceae bacterium]
MKFRMLALITVAMTLVLLGAVPATAQNRENSETSRSEETSQAVPSMGRYIIVTGVLKKQGITAYQYGSHTILGWEPRRLYALYGARGINLDRYVGRWVIVLGIIVRGYPIDFGPPLLRVVNVRPMSFPTYGS